MQLSDLYKKKKIPILTIIVSLLCLIVSIAVYILPIGHNYVALWTKNNHIWQYLSFLFVHGKDAGQGVIFHLGMNLLGLLPFGILTEKMLGTVRTFLIFLVEWFVTIALFFLLVKDEGASIVGISTIVYAYAIIAFVCFLKVCRIEGKKIWKQPLVYYFVIEFFGLISVLNPLTMKGFSILIHLSGFVVGGAAAFVFRKKLQRSFENRG